MSDAGRVLSPLKTSPLSGSQCSSCKGRDVPPGLQGAFLLLSLCGCDSSQLRPIQLRIQRQVRALPRALRCVSLPGTGRCPQRALGMELVQCIPLGRACRVSRGCFWAPLSRAKWTGTESVQSQTGTEQSQPSKMAKYTGATSPNIILEENV